MYARTRVYKLTRLAKYPRTQHKGQCWQCGTSHINLWGHWNSPKTPCQPPPDQDEGIAVSKEHVQLPAKTDVPEHDKKVATLVDMGVPEAKAVAALECSNFNLIEALTYLEQGV